MTDISKKITDNWQDSVMLVLGLWLVISPWVLLFVGIQAALWNAVVFGVVIVLMALAALMRFHDWEEWADMAIGLWLIASPWLLGFAGTATEAGMAGGAAAAAWNFVVVGTLILGLAAWSLRDHHHRAHTA